MSHFLKPFLFLVCFSSLFAEAPVEEKYPVFTEDKTVPCPECGEKEYKEIYAPYFADVDSVGFIGVSKDYAMRFLERSFLTSSMVNFSESELAELYVEHIRKMRTSAEDSSHFSGILELKISLDSMGQVRKLLLENSTTKNREFDEAVLKRVRKWSYDKWSGFRGLSEPPALYVCLRFERTFASGKEAIIKKFPPILGGSSAEWDRSLDLRNCIDWIDCDNANMSR